MSALVKKYDDRAHTMVSCALYCMILHSVFKELSSSCIRAIPPDVHPEIVAGLLHISLQLLCIYCIRACTSPEHCCSP